MSLAEPDKIGVAESAPPAGRTSDLALYSVAVTIWGSTWFAIKFQLAHVPPAVSVVWRFALAAAILLGYAWVKRLRLRFPLRQHLWIAAQGLTMFGINYIGVYVSEEYFASGLVAVIFSLTVFCNIVAMRIFFATPMRPMGLLGAAFGVAGVVLIFWPEVQRFPMTGDGFTGLAYALSAVFIATLGGMAATRNQRDGLPVVALNAWAMLYGAGFVALYAALLGQPFMFDWSFSYIASLLFLSLFGSVLAFGAYLTLMGRIGAHRAGYTAVAVPVVALLLSTLFEGLHWQAGMLIGLALCLLGNVLVLSRGNA